MALDKVEIEKNRLIALLNEAEVSEQKQESIKALIDNLAWQKVKLDETMEQMKDASVVCEYNNGGGQSGIRENPIFKGYVTLFRAYMIGLDKFTSYLPKEIEKQIETDADSMLDQVKQMKGS